ncbi:MAG: T9SS type A sorting domain-containing protein [Bacteroidia bacterium]
MRKIPILFCLAMMWTVQAAAQTITVWPGDANATQRCNHVDLLYIGQNFGMVGPARNTVSTQWSGFQVQPWFIGPAFINAANSDCDGNGVVDRDDALAIDQNFGLIHGGGFTLDDSVTGAPGSPPLQVVLSVDSIFVSGQTTIALDLNLGSANNPVDSIYGFAVTLAYDPLIVDQVVLTGWTGGFIADSSGAYIVIGKVDSVAGRIFLSITRTDHSNRSGYGTIGTIGIVMDDNIRIAAEYDLFLQPIYALGLTQSGAMSDMRPFGDVVHISTGAIDPDLRAIKVYPNPMQHQATISSPQTMIERLALRDMSGRLISATNNINSFEKSIEIGRVPAGCYMLEVYTASGLLRKKLVVQSY